MNMNIYVYECLYIHLYTFIYEYVYGYVYVYMCNYVFIYIGTVKKKKAVLGGHDTPEALAKVMNRPMILIGG
jgi:hypothetical protein